MSRNADFDFLMGDWRVRHRRLKERLAGCVDWDEFEGTSTTRPILGGNGNVEDNLILFPGGDYRASAIRAFDPASGHWSIWWLDGRDPTRIDVPVVGRFEEGMGTFLAVDSFQGRRILVRFLWSDIAARTCRWEQAFSTDDGLTWETNWIMEFERVAGATA
jgi:hypothetical protein